MENKQLYKTPRLIEYGSIADRTLGRAGGCTGEPNEGCPPKDFNACELDKFGEYSCGS